MILCPNLFLRKSRPGSPNYLNLRFLQNRIERVVP
jgi:hypothetical protein